MFYPVELLTRRRRGKLACCWLAAMTTEKRFKRQYNSVAIKRMNVIDICEEILQAINMQGDGTIKFSLYLSSQLMYGITKIHSYQIEYYEKELFKIRFDFIEPEQRQEFNTQIDEIPAIELPLISPGLHNAQLNEDLHILSGEIADRRLQMIMKDATCLNFGALTDKEVLEYNEIMLELRDKMQITDDGLEKDTIDMIATMNITEEIHQEKHSPRKVLSQIKEETERRKQRLSLTPQKRQSRPIQVETPSKRRRLSYENPTEEPAMPVSAPLENLTIPTFELTTTDIVPMPIEEREEINSSQHHRERPMEDVDNELESVHSDIYVIKKHPKKGKIIDNKITLDDKMLQKWRQNKNIHCKKQNNIPQVHSQLAAIDLFNRPTHCHKRWSANLCGLFFNHITGPFTHEDEDFLLMSTQSQPPEIVRRDTTKLDSKLDIDESSRLDKSRFDKSRLDKSRHLAITGDGSTLDGIQNVPPISHVIHETHETSRKLPLPETAPDTLNLEVSSAFEKIVDQILDETTETLEEIETLLGKQPSLEAKDITLKSSTSINSSSNTSSVQITKQDILAMLEVFWHERPKQSFVKFRELVSTDTYTIFDAATTFHNLLELYEEKKLVLHQKDNNSILWIQKYETYFDEV